MPRFDPGAIKRLRESLKLSQEKFGERIGMTRQHVYALENSDSWPSMRTIQRIIDGFGVEPSYFFVDDITPAQAQGRVFATQVSS